MRAAVAVASVEVPACPPAPGTAETLIPAPGGGQGAPPGPDPQTSRRAEWLSACAPHYQCWLCACTHMSRGATQACAIATCAHTRPHPMHKHPLAHTHTSLAYTHTHRCARSPQPCIPSAPTRAQAPPSAHTRAHRFPMRAHTCLLPMHMHARTLTRPGELLLGGGRIVVVLDQLVLAEEAVGAQGARPPCHGLSIILQIHQPGLWVPVGKGHAWGRSMALGRSWALSWLVVAPQNGCVG